MKLNERFKKPNTSELGWAGNGAWRMVTIKDEEGNWGFYKAFISIFSKCFLCNFFFQLGMLCEVFFPPS